MRSQTLRDAKATLSETVVAARRGEPTTITVRGKPAAVVVGHEEWQRITGAVPSLAELILSFPGSVEDLERDRRPARDVDL